MTKQEVYDQLKALWVEFEANHAATSKVSDTRARKALGEIKKLVTPYRNASVEEAKKQCEYIFQSGNFSHDRLDGKGLSYVKSVVDI